MCWNLHHSIMIRKSFPLPHSTNPVQPWMRPLSQSCYWLKIKYQVNINLQLLHGEQTLSFIITISLFVCYVLSSCRSKSYFMTSLTFIYGNNMFQHHPLSRSRFLILCHHFKMILSTCGWHFSKCYLTLI